VAGDDRPTCTIIAGPNGAGKTTFALRYLPDVAGHRRFINADSIAAGLSPLAPEVELVQASRLFLREIDRHLSERRDFAFETTLAGRGYLRLIEGMQMDSWRVVLIYLALLDVSVSSQRVAERVRYGGHDIHPRDIRRRFPRSLANLFTDYAPACDLVLCHDNTGDVPIPVFEQSGGRLTVYDAHRLATLERKATQ
jgi:predicted ABC-type ATPase